jgi:PKD repeat protein
MRRIDMRKIIFCLVSVVMLVLMTLPAGVPAVLGQGATNQTATNETATNETVINETATNGTIESSLVADFDFSVVPSLWHSTRISVTFTDESTGGIGRYAYDWDFGDGTRHSSAQNPTHRYISGDNYTVTLTVTDLAGNVASKSETVTLASAPKDPPLVADFDFSVRPSRSLGTRISVTFTDKSTGGTGYYIYDWDFGDNSTSHSKNPRHYYTGADNYTVTLTVTDVNGNVASKSETVTLASAPKDPPLVADFDFSVRPSRSLGTRISVTFTDKSTGGTGYYIYDWDFGDNSTSRSKNPRHYYTGTGNYTVTLTVTDMAGNVASESKTVTLISATRESSLTANFAFSICPLCSTATSISVMFTDESTGGIKPYRYNWDFGDNSTSRSQNPTHYYAGAGNYTVTLTVTDSAGRVASKSRTITVALGATTASASSNTSAKAPTTPTWPRCISGCTANDVEINSVTLDVPAGNYTIGQTVTGTVKMNLYFHRQNTYCIVVVADLYEGGVLKQADWVSNIISSNNASGNYTYSMGALNWTYGKLFKMQNILVEWSTGGPCTASCSDYNAPSKCSQATTIIILTPLVADFDFTNVCYCHNTTFTDETTGGKTPYASWYWNFGDGSNSTAQNTTHHYAGPGTYTVTLTVTDSDSPPKIDSQSHNVTVYEGPTAAFSANVTSCCKPLTVHFTDNSTAGDHPIDSWSWNFGDGATSTEENPNHTYTASGTYNVTLTVTDSHGCSDTETKTNFITSNLGPTADFSANVTSCCAPLSVSFTDLSTKGSNNISGWYWQFGDGGTSTAQNPSHTYAAGTYNVSLTVTDSHGCSDTETKTNFITSNLGPTADFSANVTSCCAPLSVSFTDLSTKGSNNISGWYWEFGDGATSTLENPSHVYAAGTYNVSLTVTDSHGCSDTETKTNFIISNLGPTADFSANVTSCCAPLSVSFTDLSTKGSNNISGWYWQFGDGGTSTAQNPSHTYAAGTYNVSLTVTDSHGCSDTETKTNFITSNLGPTADFSAVPTNGPAPLLVQFTDLSTAGSNPIVSWYWEFGDGNNSTAQNPSHTYSSAGTYTVILTVTDEHGCNDDATTTISVTLPPPPPPAGPAGCPTTKYLTVDWEGNNTTKPLYSNNKLAVDLLGPSPDLASNLFLERATHAPVVDGTTYYLIVINQLEEIPALPENTEAIVVFNVTPAGAVFDKDIFLTLGLNQTQLPENALNVTMEYYDDINHVWVPLNYEAGGPNGVAELTLSAPINHFSIYGVLAQVAPTPPANFAASGLSIMPSVEKTIFVTKTGETVTITANIANGGGQSGTYTVELKLNGETVDTKIVTLGAGQSQQVSFTQSGLAYGHYDVEVAGLSGTFTASRTITWWLIILIIVAIGLIIWGVVWGIRRRRKAHQAAE